MAVAKILSSDIAKKVVTEAGDLIKNKEKVKLKKAEDFIKTPKKKIKVGDQDVRVTEDGVSESVVTIDKKSLKVKKPDVEPIEAQDALLRYNAIKLTPKVLDDFNIKNMKSEKDIHKFIQVISKKYAGDIKDRTRGVQDNIQTKRLATLIGKDPKELTRTVLNLKKGDTLNAEYMLAARELLAAGMARLDDMANTITQGGGVNATDAMRLEFRQHFALMSEFQKIIKGVQTETARTLQSMSIPTRTKQFTNVNIDDLNTSDLIIQMGGGDEITNLATMYLKSGSTHAKLKFTTDTGGFLNLKKVSDSIAEIFINSILSAPGTHIRNTAGNWVAQGIIQVERKLASKLYGNVEGSGVAAYSDVAAAYGKSMANQEMFMALSKTFKQKGGFKKIIKEYETIVPATHGGSKLEMRGEALTASNFNIENKALGTGVDFLGNILTLGRIPTKMLTTSDNFFKNREYRAALFENAYTEAMELYKKNGLEFDDMSAFIASRVDSPTKASVESAKKAMSYSVFQTKAADRGDVLGSLAKTAQNLKNTGGGYASWFTNYYIPFTQTPINIAGFVAERTPLLAEALTGYRSKLKAGGKEATMAKIKYQLGLMFYTASIGSTVAFKAARSDGQRSEPLLIGGADIDIKNKGFSKQTKKDAFGFQANSIRIPDGKGGFHQFNLTGNDPISNMFAMSGNAAKAIEMMLYDTGVDQFFMNDSNFHEKFGDKANKKINMLEMAQVLQGLIYSFGENLVNSTYLQGAGNLFEDIERLGVVMESGEGGGKTLEQWSKKFATGFVPNIVKKGSKFFINSDFKKINNEWSSLIEGTLYNQDMPNKYNIFGKEIESFGFYSNVKLSDAQKEVYRVMPSLSRTKNNMTYKDGISLQMKNEEASFYQFHSGSLFSKRVESLIKQRQYQNADIAIKKRMIEAALTESRSTAMSFLKADGSDKYKINGAILPRSEFADDIKLRGDELLLEKLQNENDGDPFTNDAILKFEQATETNANTEQQ